MPDNEFTTIRISKTNKFNLNAIKNDLLNQVGENFTMDEVVEILIKDYLNIKE